MTSVPDRNGVTCPVPNCTQDPHGPDCIYATATPPPGEPGWKPGWTAIPDHRSLDELRQARNAENAALIRREAERTVGPPSIHDIQPPLEDTVARHAGPDRTVVAARVHKADLMRPGGAAAIFAELLDESRPDPRHDEFQIVRPVIDTTSREVET